MNSALPEGDFSVANVPKNDIFSKNCPTLDGTEKSKVPETSANVSETSANISANVSYYQTLLKLTTDLAVIIMFFQRFLAKVGCKRGRR